MRFAFDIDGTITAAPNQFAAIIEALHAAGHETHVLTGTMDQSVTPEHYEKRLEQLHGLGIPRGIITRLHIVTNPPITAKADYCRENGIDMVFEDSLAWSKPILDVCPVLLILPKVLLKD